MRDVMNDPSIGTLLERIAMLDPSDKLRFDRIFEAWAVSGSCKCPPSMAEWVQRQFGSTDRVESQTVIRVQNTRTQEGALFNPLRASRPTTQTATNDDIIDRLRSREERLRTCPFCRVREMTPVDSFRPNRIEGVHCITASNAAKYDGRHGLIVFKEHDPLSFSLAQIRDYIDVANGWFQAAADAAEGYIYPFLMWNCRWRAGGSQEHGHMQLTVACGRHYPRVESLRRAAADYLREHRSNYFADLFRVHEALGLGVAARAKVMVSICPFRDKETWILGQALDAEMAVVIHTVLATLRDHANVRSFNMGVLLPPVVPLNDWQEFPVIVRVIDRLSVAELSSDISGMGIFAGADAIASDPYPIANLLRDALR